MFDDIHLLIVGLAFTLTYLLSYVRFLQGRVRSARWLWLTTLLLGFWIGVIINVVLFIISFFGGALIFGPPLQANSWLPHEENIFYVITLGGIIAVGISSGMLSARTFNKLSSTPSSKG